MPAMTSCFAASQFLRSAWTMSYGMCVAQLWTYRRKGFSRFARRNSNAPSRVSDVPRTFASGRSLKR